MVAPLHHSVDLLRFNTCGSVDDGNRDGRLREQVIEPLALGLRVFAEASDLEMGRDARDELARGERLRQIVVGAGFEAFDP